VVTNKFPVYAEKDFPVRPELVEGWAGKSLIPPHQTIHASTKLSKNGLAGKHAASYFYRNPNVQFCWRLSPMYWILQYSYC
jgi:hypothetical protein